MGLGGEGWWWWRKVDRIDCLVKEDGGGRGWWRGVDRGVVEDGCLSFALIFPLHVSA